MSMSEISSYAVAEEASVTWRGYGVLVPKDVLPVNLRNLVVNDPVQAGAVIESQRNDPTSMARIPLRALRFKYKKIIEKEILEGYLSGTLYVEDDEIEWLWDVKCYVDGLKVDIHDALDHEELEDVADKMLDGETEGRFLKTIEYQVAVDTIDSEGNLICGDVTVSSDFVFWGSFFSTDGSNVVFSESIDLEGESLETIKATIMELLDE